jgi:hypothetical protein
MNRIRCVLFKTCAGVLLLFAGGSTALAVGSLPVGLRTVALSGATAPGAGSGVTYRTLYDADDQTTQTPVVNASGQVAFVPQLSTFLTIQPGVNRYDTAVYSEGSGSLSLIALTRTHPPGTASNVRYGDVGSVVLNDNGAVAYVAALTTSSGSDSGIFSNRSGTTSLVLRSNTQAIGYPSGVKYSSLFGPAFNNSGTIAFGTYPTVVSSPSNPAGAFYTDLGGSSFQLIARSGDPAPGIPGTNWGTMGPQLLLNNAGDMVFAAGVGDTGTWGIWSKKSGAPVTLVIHDGDPAPGLPGLNCPSYGYWSIGGADNVLLGGQLAGPGVTTDNDEAMFDGATGNLGLAVREGQQAFGLPAGVVFGDLTPTVTPLGAFLAGRTNAKGDVLFRAQLRGNGVIDSQNDSGLWTGIAASGFHVVARRGTSLGASPGGTTDVIQDTALSDLGQLAYLAGFNSPLGYYKAIMATDMAGNLVEIARTGQLVDVDNGPGVDLRTINSFFDYQNFYNGDENLINIGPSGHIVFSAQFTDGSNAILVSSAVAVPEPPAVAICALIVAARVFTRRHHRA